MAHRTEGKLDCTELLVHDVDRAIARGDEAQRRFVEEIETRGLASALEWAREKAEVVALAGFYREVRLRRQDDSNPDEVAWPRAIRKTRDRVLEDLFQDRYRGSSTSQFSNAMEHATRAAASRFMRETKKVSS